MQLLLAAVVVGVLHRCLLKIVKQMQVKGLYSGVVVRRPKIANRNLDGFAIGRFDTFVAEPASYAGFFAHFITPNSFPTAANAATARSMSALECAADICVRMRAWPFGTTGKEKPMT